MTGLVTFLAYAGALNTQDVEESRVDYEGVTLRAEPITSDNESYIKSAIAGRVVGIEAVAGSPPGRGGAALASGASPSDG